MIKKRFSVVLLFSVFVSLSARSMEPFFPFEDCIGVSEKTIRLMSQSTRQALIKSKLAGSQGNFFIQKVSPFVAENVENTKKYGIRFSVIQGNGSSDRRVDVAALQADPVNKGSLFQVASNLDCLEADGGKNLCINDYLKCNAQGEVAVLSAAPGIIDRMYLQADLRLLKDFNWNGTVPLSAGYFPEYKNLEKHFAVMSLDDIKQAASTVQVGVQHDVRVTTGFRSYEYKSGYLFFAEPVIDADQKITQVLTAALDPYNNNPTGPGYRNFARVLLHAAYKGTFDVARALKIKKVYLTLVGGGVFRNDFRWISEALCNAVNDLAQYPEAEGIEIILIVYSKPNIPTEQWNAFSSDIMSLCKTYSGTWNTLA